MVYEKTLCFGTLNPDLIYFVDALPKAGGDIRSNGYILELVGLQLTVLKILLTGEHLFLY